MLMLELLTINSRRKNIFIGLCSSEFCSPPLLFQGYGILILELFPMTLVALYFMFYHFNLQVNIPLSHFVCLRQRNYREGTLRKNKTLLLRSDWSKPPNVTFRRDCAIVLMKDWI